MQAAVTRDQRADASLRVTLVGDHDTSVVAHRAIPVALALAGERCGAAVRADWVHTTTLAADTSALDASDGIWVVPASPYASTTAALSAIRLARELNVPFLGTCGGFQHAVLEIAASLWGLNDPRHAELDPGASAPVIAPLACSLVEVTGDIRLAAGSRLAQAYGACEASEEYHCSYAFNPAYDAYLARGPLRATAWDTAGAVRGVELDGHPFFVATLFQPERAALRGVAPPIVSAFVQACMAASVSEQPRV
jgi:CTP synthase (UTP-ammonia lyase)